jgi:hypothetical protein
MIDTETWNKIKAKEYGRLFTHMTATWCCPECEYYSLIIKDGYDANTIRDQLASEFTTIHFAVGQTVINNTIYVSINFYA